MGSTRESPGTQIDGDQRTPVRRRPAQRLGISAFHDHVDCLTVRDVALHWTTGTFEAGLRFIGFAEQLASHDHDRLVISRLARQKSRGRSTLSPWPNAHFGCPLLMPQREFYRLPDTPVTATHGASVTPKILWLLPIVITFGLITFGLILGGFTS